MKYDPFRKAGLITGSIVTGIYLLIVTLIAIQNAKAFYFYIPAPMIFFMIYCFAYLLDAKELKFVTPSRVMVEYNNPVDSFFRSSFIKIVGSIVLTIICFLPISIFYILFAWIIFIFYKSNEKKKTKESN